MSLSTLDWIIIISFIGAIVWIGLSYRKLSGKSISNFFLGGRNLPWYLAGLSMVATTFAADTPLAVTELVGQDGISGNWLWWNFLAGGMLTTFFFANLWRRAEIVTEVELIELRYGGKPAKFLRGFKAVYLGLIMNVLIIGWVNLAMITILQGFFGMEQWLAMLITGSITLLVAVYASLSGLMGVVVTDAIQFVVAMTGSIVLAILVVQSDQIGGISGLKEQLPAGSLNFLPQLGNTEGVDTFTMGLTSFIAFFGFVWWASWYPGQEPGGGGYIAQRMMSTKNEKHAIGATLFFQVAHYCLRPWPWILVGLSAIVLYAIPNNIQNKELKEQVINLQGQGIDQENLYNESTAFYEALNEDLDMIDREEQLIYARTGIDQERQSNIALDQAIQYQEDKRFGYVFAMKDHLPSGLKGLLLAAFFAAFMSTISTQLNWGASYLVNDVYHRFVKPDANEKQLVFASRLSTILLMVVGVLVTLFIDSISGVWQFIMECGAGLGMVLILRWYWWRINAWSEITATIAPFIGYSMAHFGFESEFPNSFFFTVGFTTVSWLFVTFLTQPENDSVLKNFYSRISPDGWWGEFAKNEDKSNNLFGLFMCWISSVSFTYAFLFLIGKIILAEWLEAGYSFGVGFVSLLALLYFIKRTRIFT